MKMIPRAIRSAREAVFSVTSADWVVGLWRARQPKSERRGCLASSRAQTRTWPLAPRVLLHRFREQAKCSQSQMWYSGDARNPHWDSSEVTLTAEHDLQMKAVAGWPEWSRREVTPLWN